MEYKTSVGGIVALLILGACAAAAISQQEKYVSNDIAYYAYRIDSIEPVAHMQKDESKPEDNAAIVVGDMVKAYQYGDPSTAKDGYECFWKAYQVYENPLPEDELVGTNNECAKLLAEADMDAWKRTDPRDQMLVTAIAYASVDPVVLEALLSAQWTQVSYPEHQRALLAGIYARSRYLNDRDAVAGRVSCHNDFACRLGLALALQDQTISQDVTSSYLVEFSNTKLPAATGFQKFTYRVFMQDGAVRAEVVPE